MIIGLGVLIAEILPKFDVVMGIIGGTLTGPLIFILPPLFYRRICHMELQFDERKRNGSVDDLMMGNEDGDADEINLNSMNGASSLYGTFTNELSTFTRSTTNLLTEQLIDSTLCACVVAFGVIATFASTYFNFVHVSNFSDFWSPCIYNITTLNYIEL